MECYYQSFPESKEILKDSPGSGYLLRDHDCTHVVFGLDISIDQEAILDTWVLWGASFKWKYLLGYAKLPQIKDLQKRLMSELGIRGFFRPLLEYYSHQKKSFLSDTKNEKEVAFPDA